MSYSYTKHSWEDKPSSNTPITAAKLNEIEEGIYQANTNKVDKVEGKGLSTNDFDNQDVTDLAEAKRNSHTHSNKSVLDGITNVKVNSWDNKVDSVAGKGLSANDLTDELKNSYDEAVNEAHTHTNKEVIDKFSEQDGQLLYNGEEIKGGGGTGSLNKEVVTALPAVSEAKEDVIYLLESGTASSPTPSSSEIDDNNVSTDTTYSSHKITELLDAKANSSDLTAHTDNSDIHVTTEEKNNFHTHNNKTYLDKISENSSGNLTYNGKEVNGGGNEFVDKLDIAFPIDLTNLLMSTGGFSVARLEPNNFPNYVYTDGKTVHFDLLLEPGNYTSDVYMTMSNSNVKTHKPVQWSRGCIASRVYTRVNNNLVYSETTYANIAIGSDDDSLFSIYGLTMDKNKYYHIRGSIPCEMQYHKVIFNFNNPQNYTYYIRANFESISDGIYPGRINASTTSNSATIYVPIFGIDIHIAVYNQHSGKNVEYTKNFTYNEDESNRVTTIDIEI